ncbi:unnamed protein product, partial [Mesorhabditis spiculigera]
MHPFPKASGSIKWIRSWLICDLHGLLGLAKDGVGLHSRKNKEIILVFRGTTDDYHNHIDAKTCFGKFSASWRYESYRDLFQTIGIRYTSHPHTFSGR